MVKIQSVTRENVAACASFEFKGFTISMSTIFGAHVPSVAVFKGDRFIRECSSAEHAIDFCTCEALIEELKNR